MPRCFGWHAGIHQPPSTTIFKSTPCSWGVFRVCRRHGRPFSKAASRMWGLVQPKTALGKPQGPVNRKSTELERRWRVADPGECWAVGTIMPFPKAHKPWQMVGGGLFEWQHDARAEVKAQVSTSSLALALLLSVYHCSGWPRLVRGVCVLENCFSFVWCMWERHNSVCERDWQHQSQVRHFPKFWHTELKSSP